MKKLAVLFLCTSIFFGAGLPVLAADEVTTTTSVSENGDTETEYATDAPALDSDVEEETEIPSASAVPEEDYTGINNPEDNKDEMGTASNTVEIGAAGGLGFEGSVFKDCHGHWAEEIIADCTNKKYLDGYDDGTFRPDNSVTASEFSKIFSAWRGSFYQLTSGYWATPYIRKMLDDGIFQIGEYSNYDVPMTREQVAKAVISSLKNEYFPSNLSKYEELIPDISEADEDLKEYAVKAYISGIITGYEDNTIHPKGSVTRAEVLSIIDRTLNIDKRKIPKAVSEVSGGTAETYTYYTAAVQVRKSNNNNSMNYRLHTANSQYMAEDDAVSGLRLSEEMQGSQGFAMLMRYDLTAILKREDELTSVSFIINREAWGNPEMGLFWYETPISNADWNKTEYTGVINGAAVAGSDKTGYNTVVDNISAALPTWGNTENAVPDENKTQPFAKASLDGDKYYFELNIDELRAHADNNNIIEFFATTTNYDAYGLTEGNKVKCFVAGSKAPQMYCTYSTGEEVSRVVTLFADTAAIEGGMLNIFGSGEESYIENFRTEQKITYNFKAEQTGKYKMTIYYAADLNSGGGTVTFNINGSSFDHEFAQTGGWSAYVYEDLGEVELRSGNNTLILTDKEVPNTYLINVKTITFEKID